MRVILWGQVNHNELTPRLHNCWQLGSESTCTPWRHPFVDDYCYSHHLPASLIHRYCKEKFGDDHSSPYFNNFFINQQSCKHPVNRRVIYPFNLPNSFSIFCFKKSILPASPWTKRTFLGSAWNQKISKPCILLLLNGCFLPKNLCRNMLIGPQYMYCVCKTQLIITRRLWTQA